MILAAMADRGGAAGDLAPARSAAPAEIDRSTLARCKDAYKRSNERVWSQLKPLCAKALGRAGLAHKAIHGCTKVQANQRGPDGTSLREVPKNTALTATSAGAAARLNRVDGRAYARGPSIDSKIV